MNVTWPRFLPLYLYHPTIHSSLFVCSLDPSQRNNKSNQMSKDGPSVSLTCIGSRVLVLHVDWDAFKKKRKVSLETFALTLFWQRQPPFPQETSLTMGTSRTQRERSGGCRVIVKSLSQIFFFLEGLFFFFSPMLQSRHQNCLCARRQRRKALLVKILVCASGWPHTPASCQSRSSKRPFGYRASSSVLLQMG